MREMSEAFLPCWKAAGIHLSKQVDGGISSVYREVQGVADGDGQAGRKKELMAEIFKANLALQRGKQGA